MPHGKDKQVTRKNPREESSKEDEFELEVDPTAREDTLSPLYSASSCSSASSVDTGAGSAHSRSSVSSEQLEMILAANSRALADSMASNSKTMEASIMSILASMTPSGSAGSVAPTPAVASRPPVKVPKWTEGDQPFTFFTKLETALTHNGVDKATWGRLLPVYLSGRAEIAFAQVDMTLLGDYDAVKSVLLKALGDTPAHADRNWWSLARLPGETPADFYLRIRNTGLRRLCKLPTREAVVDHVILSRFLSLLPADSYTAVMSQHPKTGLEAAELLQDFEETRAYSWKRQNWKNSPSGRREHSRGGGSSSGSNSGSNGHNHGSGNRGPSESGGSPTGSNSTNGAGAKDSTGQPNSSAPSSSHNKGRGRKPIICHGCGEPGHIKPNCPNRVRRVKSPDPSQVMLVDGLLNGSTVPGMRVDTGADRTLVREDYISEDAYTGETVTLDSWRGSQFSKHRVAVINIEVDGVSVQAKVAVVDQLDSPALLGKDLGAQMTVKLLSLVLEKAKQNVSESVVDEVPMQSVNSEVTKQVVQSDVVRVTRAQAEKARKEEVANELASANSGSEPLALSDIFDFEDEFFVDDKSLPDPNVLPTPLHELEGLVDGVEADLPLPKLSKGDGNSLCSEQKADPTLKAQWLLGEKFEKGYSFVDGILVHTTSDELGDEFRRILVPKGRRKKVLELAHTHSLAGHFGGKKTFARLSGRFLWPRMWVEVKEFVRSCSGCQRASRKDQARAPLQPLQVESEPFSKVAYDIVGPLPKSRSGYRYVLTMMDLFSKFPAAVPLKKVDNTTVLDAMLEVFASYGLPKVLLTDQGSVFTSRLTRAMCKQFGIAKIQTTPYHPQSDGALERFHASLKGMLKRSGDDLKNWDKSLKYLLFAYRSTPHCTTGYAPFTLLFGRDVRGPLDILHEAWLQGDCEQASVHEWLSSVQAQISEMSVLVGSKESVAKAKMKAQYDRSACVKEFSKGDLVLVWKPGLHSKMGASWDGPYVVGDKKSPVTYSVHVSDQPHKAKVLHVNLLKRWTTPASHIHRVAIVQDEDDGDETCPVGLRLGRPVFVPSRQQQAALDKVLGEFPEVLRSEPGRTCQAELVINTGDHPPVSSHPYRIAPRYRDEVKAQINHLLELGILQPSTSPWSSSIVTVKKKDGGIRICIDFRAVNAISAPDPYQMPLIEELLDLLGAAKFISKVDLNKGFHQIPISPPDMSKTAFCTPWGKFEFKVMPFGLRNGPAVFQRLMDQVLHRDSERAVVYIDDIGIFSATWNDHCQDIRTVLSRLKEAGLTANLSKCSWGQTHCEFLGHLVGEGMVSPADLKVQAVRQFAQPVTKKNVRQFLGLTGYYRRFVPEYASHSFNLTETTRKSAPERVAWNEALEEEFIYLKSCICSAPCLTLPVVGDVFVLQTDASGIGVGAVLAVVRDGLEYPVAYYSRKLLPRERKYSASELEGLAVISSVKHFDAYLMTHPFTLQTDHRALLFLNDSKQNNGRLARWALLLQQFTFSIVYKKGSLHTNADALSRMFSEDPPSRMPEAPAAYEGLPTVSLPVSPTAEEGGDVMESPSPAAADTKHRQAVSSQPTVLKH